VHKKGVDSVNVIVSNKQKEIIDNANIDAIKDLNGLFNVSDLINKFKNYFFSKMILDATSVVDFASKDVLTTLANEIGPEKLIILLPATPEPPEEFKKLLIELKIYNFTNNINDVVRFIEKSNTYEDAAKLLNSSFSNDIYVDNSIKEGEDESEEEESSEEAPSEAIHTGSSLGDILSNLSLGNDTKEEVNLNTDDEVSELPSTETEETNNNINDNLTSELNLKTVLENSVEHNEPSKNTFLINDDFNNSEPVVNKPTRMVIGVKNVTLDAGSTSLIYMLHKAATNLNKNVLSIEIGKNDFRLFRNNKMVSTTIEELNNVIDNSNADLVFIDMNDTNNIELCNEILYLVEPSTIKLNGLMATNRNIFNELKDKKVLLNKSLLSSNDVKTLESEAGLNFFANIEPLNDRINNDVITKLLSLLGVK
jgi:hypothetical protein